MRCTFRSCAKRPCTSCSTATRWQEEHALASKTGRSKQDATPIAAHNHDGHDDFLRTSKAANTHVFHELIHKVGEHDRLRQKHPQLPYRHEQRPVERQRNMMSSRPRVGGTGYTFSVFAIFVCLPLREAIKAFLSQSTRPRDADVNGMLL